MTTIWTSTPAVSVASINELRTAVDAAVEAAEDPPVVWTDGSPLPSTMSVKAKYVIELRDAIQALWNKDDRKLGLIPNWTTGVVPGLPAPTQPSILIRETDVTDLRKWFNHYETWGDLRGIHWWKDTTSQNNNLIVFPRVGWNVETVIGVTKDNAYHSSLVSQVHGHCVKARNYGLVNIVRIDWKQGYAVPTAEADYFAWKNNFNRAVNALKDVATIFIVGNEPTIEPHNVISSSHYANAFRSLYADKVAGTMYLAAGPAAFSETDPPDHAWENDIIWLRNASNLIAEKDGVRGDLDGWALHTYGSPYLPYAYNHELDLPCNASCVDPAEECRPTCRTVDTLTGDAGFQRYREYMEAIGGKWASKSVYFTETNTQGYRFDEPAFAGQRTPAQNYVTGWIQKTYQEIRRFNREANSNRDNYPRILCLCWFVDDHRNDNNWKQFALSNSAPAKLRQARADLKASNTSTGITESSRGAVGPDSEREVVERSPGINTLAGTIA